jgi:toxin-antitoxin system PIN domain toxin
MKLLDLNLLLYAVNADAVHHQAAKQWLDTAMSEDEPIGLSWVVVLGFLRIATNPRILPTPLSVEQAISAIDAILAHPTARLVAPGDEHWRILKSMLSETGTAGNLTTDAHLAALAIEHGATMMSTDTDFQRFHHLRWNNPLLD